MRKAAESSDNFVMALGMGQPGLAKPTVEPQCDLLIGQILGMRKGQREEEPQFGVNIGGMTARLRLACESTGLTVGRIHPCRTAKGVARKLVKQDYQRQRPFGRTDPALGILRCHMFMQRQKAVVKNAVKSRALREPVTAPAGLLPEGDDILCFGVKGNIRGSNR